MDPYYRFFPFKNPLSMISWNAVWGCDTFERLIEKPEEAETVNDVRSYHVKRMLADGFTNSALDPMPNRIPYYCYLGYALGGFGIMPLAGRVNLRWYPVEDVRSLWDKSPAHSKSALEKTVARIEQKYGVILKAPPETSLP